MMCVPRDFDYTSTNGDAYSFQTWCGRTVLHPGAFGPRGEPVYKSVDFALKSVMKGDGVCLGCCQKLSEVFQLPAKQAELRASVLNAGGVK